MDQKIKIKICVGTYCHVMGGYKLRELRQQLPEALQDKVKVEASVCLGCSTLKEKPQPPYAEINEKLMPDASLEKIIEELQKIA